ncbi:uncharacterized protein LOC134216703 [Armigeres subalbatus]|uniref:uncharacterized protein LOC134216703 n=1 Tax=Armigeres subalbatus TaxID=124917 RepID=UPI002ED6A271
MLEYDMAQSEDEQPQPKLKKKSKFREMARQLAAEKAKNKVLMKKLKQRRMNVKCSKNQLSIDDGSTGTNSSCTFEGDNGFSSTRSTMTTAREGSEEATPSVTVENTDGINLIEPHST